jgi:hypothetical protein
MSDIRDSEVSRPIPQLIYITKPKGDMARKKLRQNMEGETLKYLVREGGGRKFGGGGEGQFVIEIPASWKVTFSSVNPNSQHPGEYCLRVWEGEKLRAVYCDVVAFRDLSIPMAREIRKETGSSTWENDSDGNFSESRTVSVDRAMLVEDVDQPF